MKNRGRRGFFGAVLAGAALVVLAAAASCSKGGWQGAITKEGDVTVVSNPKEPIYPTPILQLREDFVLGGKEAGEEMSFADNHSAYRSFFADDEGHLFVQTWERTPDGKFDVTDIFDGQGRFLSRAPMPVHPDFQAPLPRVMKNGKLYTIEPDEEGTEVVKRYSVTWKVK